MLAIISRSSGASLLLLCLAVLCAAQLQGAEAGLTSQASGVASSKAALLHKHESLEASKAQIRSDDDHDHDGDGEPDHDEDDHASETTAAPNSASSFTANLFMVVATVVLSLHITSFVY
mmetsp:Transcript_49422/g.77227  ORF Transcript_49422/g.77227 Transcript_49422/m.77227 type:complete len:119 (+) Transcript_49422:21-377(+)